MRKNAIQVLDLKELLKAPDGIARVSRSLVEGAIIVYPTETIYGIGCDPFAPGEPLKKIYQLKQRPEARPFIYLIPDSRYLEENSIPLLDVGKRLAGHFWPGPLTMILSVPPDSPLSGIAFQESLAVRVSPHPFVKALFSHRRFPLVSTSANLSGAPEEHARDPKKIETLFSEWIDLFVSEGYKAHTSSSTILDLTKYSPAVVREGGIKRSEVYPVLSGKE